jgi:TonB family protein
MERRFLASSTPAPAHWQGVADGLAARLGAGRSPRLRISAAADSPLVIGWLRPVILVPASALLAIAPEAMEAVLAHELAHVRRGDFLANLLQSIAEALLFFHPAAWWLSGQVRELREHCCDDAAAALVGDPMALAQGLASLERLRRKPSTFSDSPFALGAAKGNLMPRIQRLFVPRDAAVPTFRGLTLLLGACAFAGVLTLACQSVHAQPAPVTADVDFSQVKVVHQPTPPAYPPMAKIDRIQGTVVVVVTIDDKGVPTKVEAVEGPEELRPTAVDYAKGWLFAPFVEGGRAVPARFKLTMPFKLR